MPKWLWPTAAAAAAAAAASATAASGLGSAGGGDATCPCIDPHAHPQTSQGIASYVQGGSLTYAPAGGAESYTLPAAYGVGCKAHDLGTPPSCLQPERSPAWCSAGWCYVVPTDCEGLGHTRSKYFSTVSSLHFSYATCRGSDGAGSSNKWTAEDRELTRRLVGLASSYSGGVRHAMEAGHRGLDAGADPLALAHERDMRNCATCRLLPSWQVRLDFDVVGMLEGPTGTERQRSEAVALSGGISPQFKAVAAQNSPTDDHEHVGYQYAADKATGGYSQWPMSDASAWYRGYDPRYRPWFAAGATGPKDVVIVVDVSQSMFAENRHEMAKNATKRILDTLSWKDFATIILFDGGLSAVYSDLLKPVTDAERDRMKDWCDRQFWAMGSTNFKKALEKAARVVMDSVAAGATSMCQKAVMFLTDGIAQFSDADFAMFHESAREYDITVFSYALGSGASMDVPKRLACQNDGVFYQVADGANLSDIMARYYDYFAQGQEICSPTYVKYLSTDRQILYGACLPSYSRERDFRSLLGVSCLDVNMLGNMRTMSTQTGWKYFKCQASDRTKMCQSVAMSECHLQQIRRQYDASSVCEDNPHAATSEACPCRDSSCQDDLEFQDAKQYFCDTWVGDDCNNPNPIWGYTAANMAEVRQNCPRSCGLCGWSTDCSRAEECHSGGVQEECRACVGVTSGTDIDGDAMACPPDAPRNLMKREPALADRPPGASDSPGPRNPPIHWLLTAAALLTLPKGADCG